MKKLLLTSIALFGLALAFSLSALAGEIEPNFAAYLETLSDDDFASAIIYLQDRPNIKALNQTLRAERAPMKVRHERVLTVLKQAAERSQPALVNYLSTQKKAGTVKGYTPYWIMNLVVIYATKAELERIAQRGDVEAIEGNFRATLIESAGDAYMGSPTAGIGVTHSLRAIFADSVWYNLGLTGYGRLVGNLDSGVDGDHVALTERWRGNWEPWQECWRDGADYGTQYPTDYNGHGTHVMGTICGAGHGTGDTIGVAWEAVWIADNSIDQSVGSEFDNDVIAAFQWFSDPDGDSSTHDDVPDVVQNSWGIDSRWSGYQDCDYRWQEAIENCEAAGVVCVFSAGNEGPFAQSLRSPANICNTPTVNFSVGAVDCENYGWPYPIWTFSSRGPSDCDRVTKKPEVVAPGVDVYYSIPGDDYTRYDETSMAGPHVAGVVALMRQTNPDLDVDSIKIVLMNTARDLGSEGEDNTCGWGIIDAYQAVLSVYKPDTIPPAAITDLAAATGSGNGEVDLTWTAPGDDGNQSETRAKYYDIRYVPFANGPIDTETEWENATQVEGEPIPWVQGTSESMTVTGLTPGDSYYFAIRSYDEASNESDLSNSPWAKAGEVQTVKDYANQDIPVKGTVYGDYTDTWASDNIYESIEEVIQPPRRSILEHKWTINVPGGTSVTFNVEAYHSPNTENDDFAFAYSTDDVTYTDILTVYKTSDVDQCVTGSDGTCEVASDKVRNPTQNFCFHVDSLKKEAYYWDSTKGVTYNCISPPAAKLATGVPTDFVLSQNYPNPFNPETEFSIELPSQTHVSFVIYNIAGQKVKTLVDDYMDAGVHTIRWDGTNESGEAISSGIYFYRVVAEENIVTRKMILMK